MMESQWLYFSKDFFTLPHHDNNYSKVEPDITSVAFCSNYDILGIATRNGNVLAFDPERRISKTISNCDISGDQCHICELSWNPSKLQLIGGRADGQIICWTGKTEHPKINPEDDYLCFNDIQKNRHVHSHAIIRLIWKGDYFFSADDSGCCALWNTGTKEQLIPLNHIMISCGITISSINSLAS